MTDLAAWILERIESAEEAARDADGREWWIADTTDAGANIHDAATGKWVALEVRERHAEHIARHDPARVLAQCAAYKMVVYLHGPYRACGEDICASCGRETPYPCRTLRALASVWVDHPDYDPVWRLA